MVPALRLKALGRDDKREAAKEEGRAIALSFALIALVLLGLTADAYARLRRGLLQRRQIKYRVGFSAGGSSASMPRHSRATWANTFRAIRRSCPAHAGAGGLVAANYVYNNARATAPNSPSQPDRRAGAAARQPEARFDPLKFN